MKIVRIALEKYFFNNIPIEDTIKNHTNIYDFCLRLRTNSSSTPQYKYIEESEIKIQNLTKTTRYYIANSNGILQKEFKNNKIIGINVGYSVNLFNKYKLEEMKNYNINYQFYITEARKIINIIEDKQLKLF